MMYFENKRDRKEYYHNNYITNGKVDSYFSQDGCKDKIPSDQYITLDKLEEVIEKSNKAIIEV